MAEPWAAKFYNSKEWKSLRLRLITERNFCCEDCGKNFTLNPANINPNYSRGYKKLHN